MRRGFAIQTPLIGYNPKFLLFTVISISIFLRIINLGSREFWYDEVLSLLLSTGKKLAYHTPKDFPIILKDYQELLSLPTESNLSDIGTTIKHLLMGVVSGEPHPALFFLSQHFWLRLFGNTEAAMRSLSAFLSLGAIASAYGLGRVLLSQRGGLLLAALLAINPYYLFHSLNVRMYGFLVLWIILSAWALLELITIKHPFVVNKIHLRKFKDDEVSSLESPIKTAFNSQKSIFWSIVLIVSVAGGLLTFYLFAYWLVTLLVLILYLDWRRCWEWGRLLGAGVLLTIPWDVWGMRQQLRNADFGRFSTPQGFWESNLRHLQDVVNTLGTHLIVGDWVTSLPPMITTLAGCWAMVLLLVCTISLWHQGENRVLGVALLLGIFPLMLALTIDILTRKFTLGFGWGRTMIFILPGCLLLLTVWVEKVKLTWSRGAATVLLLFYLTMSIGDFTLRPRQVFHQIADLIPQTAATPTLIAINSKAWGHLMRLAYYFPKQSPVMLLAEKSSNLASGLEKVLQSNPTKYQRILWLDSFAPVWSPPTTETEKQQIQQVLAKQFQLASTHNLSGTMNIDKFNVQVYRQASTD